MEFNATDFQKSPFHGRATPPPPLKNPGYANAPGYCAYMYSLDLDQTKTWQIIKQVVLRQKYPLFLIPENFVEQVSMAFRSHKND